MDTETKSGKEWMTVQEVGEWLGVGRSTAYDLVYRLDLPSYKIGGTLLRVRRQDLEAWLEGQRNLPKF